MSEDFLIVTCLTPGPISLPGDQAHHQSVILEPSLPTAVPRSWADRFSFGEMAERGDISVQEMPPGKNGELQIRLIPLGELGCVISAYPRTGGGFIELKEPKTFPRADLNGFEIGREVARGHLAIEVVSQ